MQWLCGIILPCPRSRRIGPVSCSLSYTPVLRACRRWMSLFGLILLLTAVQAARATSPGLHSLADEVLRLDRSVPEPTAAEVLSGALDTHFTATAQRASRGEIFWLKLRVSPVTGKGNPVLNVHAGLMSHVQIYPAGGSSSTPLPLAARLPEFAGQQDLVFILPAVTSSQGLDLYARVQSAGVEVPRFSTSTLDVVLAYGAARGRTITLAFGALISMAAASLLIWAVLAEKTFVLYGSLFLLQALYVAYFS